MLAGSGEACTTRERREKETGGEGTVRTMEKTGRSVGGVERVVESKSA
jgi:hypothetical protein